MRRRAAIYCLDQDERTTSSPGIYNYTRDLVASVCRRPDPGFDLHLWVSAQNQSELVPSETPEWIRVRVCRGSYGTGVSRLFADHALAPAWMLRDRIDLVHFPKGWLPAVSLPRVKLVATVHDTILHFYRRRYPGYFPKSKIRYFTRAMRHTLRRADRILTPSHFSAEELRQLEPDAARRISIVPDGGIRSVRPAGEQPRSGVIVLGSRFPHKQVPQTLRLLADYARSRNTNLKVRVTAVSKWEDISDEASPEGMDVTYLGRISYEDVLRHIGESRALVLLSEVEGFGLPALEAYSMRTPVCYRRATAVSEVLNGCPGGWDGERIEGFFSALEEVLALAPQEIEQIRNRLADRYNWDSAVDKILELYGDLLE